MNKSKEISNQFQKKSQNKNEPEVKPTKNEQKVVTNESKNSEILESKENFDAADLAFNSLIAGYGAQYTNFPISKSVPL